MAKKKQTKQDSIVGSLYKELSKINPDDMNNLLEVLSNQLANMANFPHVEYGYQHPDYAEKARPVAEYLHPIEQLGWDFDIPEAFIKDLLSRPSDQLADDLENLIINSLALFHQHVEDELPFMQSKIIVALLLLKEIGSPKSLDIVLETLRQDMPFIETFIGEVGPTIFPQLIDELASNQLPKLLEFMKEPGILPFSKSYVSIVVTNVACTTPERRMEVISWLNQVLNFYYDHIYDTAIFDCIIIDSIAFDIMNIHGRETLPILKKIYATDLVPSIIAPDIEAIDKNIDETITEKINHSTIYQTLEDVQAFYSELEEELEEEEESEAILAFQNFMQREEPKKERKAPTKKPDTAQKVLAPKCFTLQISLRYVEPIVWRLIDVPSWTTLPQLHNVIQTAMGWKNCRLHQFNKKETYYTPLEQIDEPLAYSSSPGIDYTDITIGELLARKRSKISYECTFSSVWEHDIILTEQRPYRPNEQPRFHLLNGANACPPEGCGGWWGYLQLKETLKHKDSEAYKKIVDWLGESFDPKAFDKKAINKLLEKL